MDCFYKKEMDEKDLKLIKEKIKRLNSKHIFNLSNVRLLLMIIITALLWIVLLKLGIARPRWCGDDMDKNEKTAKVLGIVSFVLSILGLRIVIIYPKEMRKVNVGRK